MAAIRLPEQREPSREERRVAVLRHVRARQAAQRARQSATLRTAFLLRSVAYHDDTV
jgi:hypothetical protein